MPQWGAGSLKQRATCDERLQRVFDRVIQKRDCTWLEGKRSEAQQIINVAKGVSKTMNSTHVYPLNVPSRGADVAPYPLKWPKRPDLNLPPEQLVVELAKWQKDVARYYYFAGYVLAIAEELGTPLRFGGDWDGDNDIHEQSFDDLVHYELLT